MSCLADKGCPRFTTTSNRRRPQTELNALRDKFRARLLEQLDGASPSAAAGGTPPRSAGADGGDGAAAARSSSAAPASPAPGGVDAAAAAAAAAVAEGIKPGSGSAAIGVVSSEIVASYTEKERLASAQVSR